MRDLYRSEITQALMKDLNLSNIMEVPRITKVVLNIGVGEALTSPKAIEGATADLTAIAGQKPLVTRARKSIANFKLREGQAIGVAVTLRGTKMWHFMDRLINVALPRIRDFHGISRNGFDGRGNFSMGLREQIMFPEIDYTQVDKVRGLQITFVTTAKDDQQAMRLLEKLGMPFTRVAAS